MLENQTVVRARVVARDAPWQFVRLEVEEVLSPGLSAPLLYGMSEPFTIEGGYHVFDSSRPGATDYMCSPSYPPEPDGEVLATFSGSTVLPGVDGQGGEAGTSGTDAAADLIAGPSGFWLMPWREPFVLGADGLTRAQLVELTTPATCETRYPSALYAGGCDEVVDNQTMPT